MDSLDLNERVREAQEPGSNSVALDSRAWPSRVEERFVLVPATHFNRESPCGLPA